MDIEQKKYVGVKVPKFTKILDHNNNTNNIIGLAKGGSNINDTIKKYINLVA